MSETTGPGRRTNTSGTPASGGPVPPDASRRTPVVHESYSFVCLRCGHGWEQSYDIEHHVDAQGKEFVVYMADGRKVPSPLSQPTCDHCDGHLVRIMRPGRVSTVLDSLRESAHGGHHHTTRAAHSPTSRSGAAPRTGATDSQGRPTGTGAAHAGHHLWHMSSLVRLLHLQRRPH